MLSKSSIMMLCFDTNFLHYLGSSSFQHIEGKSPSFQHPSQPGRIDGLKWIESFDASQAPSRDVGPLVGKRCVLVKDLKRDDCDSVFYDMLYILLMGFRSLKSGIGYCVFLPMLQMFCSTYMILCIYRIHESYNT